MPRKAELMSQRKILVFTIGAFVLVGVMLAGGMAWGGAIKLRVSAEQANIREKPDITSAILRQLPEGTALEAERKEGEWYAVLVEKEVGGSVLGYVHESLVVVIEPAPPEPSPKRERAEEQEPRQPPPQTPAAPGGMEKSQGIGLVIWFGGRHAAVGDLNEGAEGLARYYGALLSANIDGEVEELHFGYLLGAEVRVPLAPGLYFSVGAERSSGEVLSTISYQGGTSEASYSTKPSLRTTPVSLALLIYPMRVIYIKAGLDYTFARCSYYYRFATPGPDEQTEVWQEWKGEATSSGFGYQLGLGLEWSLGSHVSLIAEGAYRYSRFDGFEGEDFYRESTGGELREEGTLYRFRKGAGGRETYPLVFVRNKEPADAGVTGVRGAELDLSGYSLKLGFKVGF